jgi:hypothetical protein
MCRLQLNRYEVVYAQRTSELSVAQSEFHQRRIDGVHRRYLASIKALAQVRRLHVPAVQLKIEEKQVNVAS